MGSGVVTVDTVVARVVTLLQQYHAANVTVVDTRNNVLGAGTDNDFTTPTIVAADFQSFIDRNKGKFPRCLVTDEGTERPEEWQDYGMDVAVGVEPGAKFPRINRTWAVRVSFMYSTAGGSQTTAGTTAQDHARRVVNRLADGGRIVMARYPHLAIPATSTEPLVAAVTLRSDDRAREVDVDAVSHYQRDIRYDVQAIDDRT
jgi:hypothetical protein